MAKYFIVANSFAAPFFSDTSEHWQAGKTPEDALAKFAKAYDHPCGLFAAACFKDANAKAKNAKALAHWMSPEARKQSAR